MNSPNESMHMSAAADDYAVDLGDAPLSAVDLQKSISDNPMAAALVAAAAGAGLMGLMMLAMRSSPTPAQQARQFADRAMPSAATRQDLADLRDQFTAWARDMMAAAPSRSEVKNLRDQFTGWVRDLMDAAPSRGEVKKAAGNAGETLSTTWDGVRDQATDLAQKVRSQFDDTADKLRPKVNAAVDLAKENPMWVGVAAAALAALIGASAIAGSRK